MLPPRRPLRLTRRTSLLGLAGLVGAATASCTANDSRAPVESDPTGRLAPSAEPAEDPDVALAANALAAEQDMVDLIGATVAAHPALERALAGTSAVHDEHVTLLADAAPVTPAPSDDVSEDSDSPAGRGPRRQVPRNRAEALTVLARRETRLSLAAKQGAFAAESGAFARVLGSMAAAAAQQAVVLRDLRTRQDGGR